MIIFIRPSKPLAMKFMFRLFFFLYAIAPLICVPFIAYKEDNWYILFGIGFLHI